MDVGTWLGSLGLDQYEPVFREKQIEAHALAELTEQELRDIGVPLGHRLRMLRAIRELTGQTLIAVQSATADAAERDGAERRHMTVMFCELVGLGALTARLDPEDTADLIRAAQGAIAAAVARFGGHVAKWVGDGATIYFGYPRAHEDDAKRAARAGLALIDAVAKLGRSRGVALDLRIGISSGLVVVGELIGEGEARERGVVGDTANLAARLRSQAEPGSILVSESTRRLLGQAFEIKALASQTLKGFRSPVAIWRVIREQENFSRFDASRAEALTPLVGRSDEIALLLERWQQAAGGEGQVVLLSGEAGIGKSRILATLRDSLDDERHIVMRYQCSPHHLDDAFHPVIGQIRHAAGFVSGEPAADRLDKLEQLIERTGLPRGEIVPALAALFAIPTANRYPPLDMTPAELRERTLSALLAMTAAFSRQAPVLIVLEDAHWIDPTTLDLINRMVNHIPFLPILLAVTFRPEFSPPWSGSHVTSLPLNRLGRLHAFRMIDGVTAGKKLPAEVVDQIVAKTDGVPLFMEELTKSVLESDLLREEADAYVLASSLAPLAIPSTLHDSLTARLDRLSPIKETAQIGAAIGREFPHSLLEAISPIKGDALDGVLRQLMDAELIHCSGTPPKASYVFKHALVQDAAYGSLLRSRRQGIHARIACALKQHVTDDEYAPATVAHHFTEAGLTAPAVAAWLGAAELALSRSAPVEAERHASRGLALISDIAEGRERDALGLSLLVARAYALVPLKGISAPETFEVMSAAKELLDRGVGTDLQRVSILFGLCSEATLRAKMQPALDFAHQIIEVAERQDDPTFRLVAYRMLATNQFYAGHSRLALDSLLRAKQYCDPGRQRALSHRFGWDPSIALLAFEVLVRLSLGLIDSAADISEQVQAEIASHTHATTIANAKFCAVTWPKAILGDLAALETGSRELIAYCAEKRAEQIRLLASMHCAYACAMREPEPTTIVAMRAAFDQVRQAGGLTGSSMIMAHLAEVALEAGELAEAEADLAQGFAFVEQSGERFWLAELHRLSGQLALRRQEPDRMLAEACFRRAIDIARSQQGRLLELRAANDLAGLWRDSQSNHDARVLLEPVLAAIEGGAASRDVREARALLAALA
jgi:class 3 adenylate cyclase/predicted ATPase